MMEIHPDLIRQLADLLDETKLTEIEITDGDQRVRVARYAGGGVVPAAQVPTVAVPAPAEATAPAGGDAPVSEGHPITAPMVGTAYLAPEPGAAPFVRVGDRVSDGETVMIVEAMKVMNPIRAPRAGVVKAVAVTDGQPVEYGEVLLTLE